MNEDMEEVEGTSGGNGSKLAIAAVLAFLIGGGAGYAGSQMIGGAEAAPSEQADEESAEEGRYDRVIVPLEPFTVNLRGSGGGRVLRLQVQLEVERLDATPIEESKPRLRDAVLSLASDYTFTEMEGIDGKMHFRDELLGRLNRMLDGPRVQRIYFTEFVVH